MKYLYTLIILFLLAGCDREEWLDIKPKGVVIPSKTSDYRLLMNQIDKMGVSPGFANSYSNTDLMDDDFQINSNIVNFLGNLEKRMYVWSDNFFDPGQEDNDWATLYGQIYVTNVVAEEIMEADGPLEEKRLIDAEAKVQNAFAYFSLVNLYAVHYNPNTASSVLAIPFRKTTAIENVRLPRASVQEIYDHILNNLNSALAFLPDLPDANSYKIRPTKVSVYAFLSRVYLYMGRYSEALQAADNALKLKSSLLNYNQLSSTSGIINLPIPLDNPEVIWYKKSTSTYRTLVIDPALYNLHADSDQRKRKYGRLDELFGVPGDDYVLAPQFFTNIRFSGFSVPELLLARAECNARLGNLSSALDDINSLREKRIAAESYSPVTSTDKNQVLEWVLLQRRLELVGQGLRLFDLKRFNQFDGAAISLTHSVDSQSKTLLPGSKNWAVPVAQKYILQNPEIGANIRD